MEGTLRKRILELERRSKEIDGLLSLTENEKFAWTTLCDIPKRVQQCVQHYNVSLKGNLRTHLAQLAYHLVEYV